MPLTTRAKGPLGLRDDLRLLETETFEIQDHQETAETLAATTSCTSTTSSSTSCSGTSCCG